MRITSPRYGSACAGAALLTLLLTGCVGTDSSPWSEQLDGQLRADGLSRAALDPAPPPTPIPTDAGPDDYARLAVMNHPAVSAARAAVARQAARIPQARAIDDPMLTVMPIGPMAETAAGQVTATVGLSQTLPLPQKLNAKADAARFETFAAQAELERAELEVAAEARRSFWRYWLADRTLTVTRQSRDLLADLQEAATAQLRAGRAGQADVLRAATELAALDNALIDLDLDRTIAMAALNRLLNRPTAADLPAPPDVQPNVPDLDAETTHPLITARLAQIDAAKRRLRLAELNGWPDVTLMANYGFVDDDGLAVMANGKDQWSVGFGINLPIYRGKRRAEVREQLAAVLESEAKLNAASNDVAFDIREASAEVEAQRRLLELFDQTVLPQARQTVDATAAAYRAGNTDFLSYVDAWRRLLDFEIAERRATSSLGRAAANLQQALALPTELQP